MKKQQWLVIGGGLTLLLLLLFFGITIPPKKDEPVVANTPHTERKIETEKLLTHAKERLTPQQLQKVVALENSISRGDIKAQQMKIYAQLISFWGDTIRLFEPYAYYTGQLAKLENSEKSLTFAAHLFLNNLKTEEDPAMQNWLATNAKDLFKQALEVNPANDSSKVGLGACYIFGNISDNPMEGIAMIREVVEKNPKDLFAQMVLGLGGIRSGQYDKAIERFLTVIKQDPENLEAMLNLAETYDRKGEKENAIKWYTEVKQHISNPDALKELENRIKQLQ